jgi:CIC family chloride channel protein
VTRLSRAAADRFRAWRQQHERTPPGLRERVPAPLIKRRLPSNAPAMMQPNVTGDGDTPLTTRFWAMVVLTGIATGLLGDLMMVILFSVAHLAFGSSLDGQGFTAGVTRAGAWQRAVPLLIAGVVGGPAWYLLRRFTPGQKSEIDEVIWDENGEGRQAARRGRRQCRR